MCSRREWPSQVIRRQAGALADLVVLGERTYARLIAQLPESPTELQALPALFLRHGVLQLAATNVLVARHAITAAAPYARGLYETVVNMMYVDQDSTGDRAAAYVAYSIAADEAEAEARVPGTKSAEARIPFWNAAVGEFPAADTSDLQARLQKSRERVHDPRIAKHLKTHRNTLPTKVGRTEWSGVLGHDSLYSRAEVLVEAEHYIGLYRSVYRLLSHDAHAVSVLDGFVRNEAGETSLLGIYTELTPKAAGVLDAITGLGLNAIDHVLETHLGLDRDLAAVARRIHSSKGGP
jgi:hypothetical protein